jgi:hypothetical protein
VGESVIDLARRSTAVDSLLKEQLAEVVAAD